MAAATLVVAGCVLAGGPGAPTAERLWQQVRVAASPEANQGMATALDIVLVYDVVLMPRLPVTAAQWFEQRAALQAGAGRGLQVIPLQIPASSSPQALKLPRAAAKAAGALVYAGFLPGSSPTAAPLAPHPCVQINLDAQGLKQSACAGRP